jgi:hypothetical protein
MNTDGTFEKCFARETGRGDEPTYAWKFIQLEQYAPAQHEAIVRGDPPRPRNEINDDDVELEAQS